MLLYVASRARVEPQYSLFVYLQNLAVLIVTISKMGVDTLLIADAEKEFRLGAKGSALLLAALLGCTLGFAGIADMERSLAALCLSALSLQNALKAALATREAHYMRAAIESAWVLPSVLAYVLARQGEAQAWEIATVAALLFTIRIDGELLNFLFGEPKGGFQLKRVSMVWLFQVLNIGLFRLDQTLVAVVGTRGGGTQATADLLFWAKANDLSNAVATALGGVANREEIAGRSQRTSRLIRWGFPVACLLIYVAAWAALSPQIQQSFLVIGLFSLVSAGLAYEVNRNSFGLMWRKEYAALIRFWSLALMTGGFIAAIGLLTGQTWLLPLAVTVQLLLSLASFKKISNTKA